MHLITLQQSDKLRLFSVGQGASLRIVARGHYPAGLDRIAGQRVFQRREIA